MNVSYVDAIVERVLHASAATYVYSALIVLLSFILIIAGAARLTPKKDRPEETLKWPNVEKPRNPKKPDLETDT